MYDRDRTRGLQLITGDPRAAALLHSHRGPRNYMASNIILASHRAKDGKENLQLVATKALQP